MARLFVIYFQKVAERQVNPTFSFFEMARLCGHTWDSPVAWWPSVTCCRAWLLTFEFSKFGVAASHIVQGFPVRAEGLRDWSHCYCYWHPLPLYDVFIKFFYCASNCNIYGQPRCSANNVMIKPNWASKSKGLVNHQLQPIWVLVLSDPIRCLLCFRKVRAVVLDWSRDPPSLAYRLQHWPGQDLWGSV